MSMRPAMLHRWSDLTTDAPMPMLDRKRIIGDQMMLSLVHLNKGCVVPMHVHANEQFAYILRGWLRFTIGDKAKGNLQVLDVRADEVLHLPGNVPHAAEAMADTIVLDCFSPPSATTGIDRK